MSPPAHAQIDRTVPEALVDVAIVGAGPVGLTLAVLLAQLGRSVVVLERWPQPYRLPRAVHFDDEVGRIFQSCGLGGAVRALSEPAEVYEWRNAAGLTLLRFGRVGAGPSGWPFSSMFCQPELEAEIEARADSFTQIEVRRGVAVETIEQDGRTVAVRCADGQAVMARYAVGCDGANSTVREQLGVEVDDRGFFYDWLIVDVSLDEPRVFDPLNLQVCDPDRPTTAVSGGPGRRRWEFMRLPHETIEELNDEQRAWELLEPWDITPANARLERHAVYTFQARVATKWQVDRVLLAGDAAHLMPPFAGQGMCAGIRDAANLAWKLDLVLGGHADHGVLATYEQERLPSARAAIDFSIELGHVICVADSEEAATRDVAMSAMVTDEVTEVATLPGIAEGMIDSESSLAGALFPQFVADGGWFDDVHGAGWRLVTDCGDPTAVNPDLVRWFGRIGGSVVAADFPGLSAWLDAHEARWALQRPDFHLYGIAADVEGASALLHRLRNHLVDGRCGVAPERIGL